MNYYIQLPNNEYVEVPQGVSEDEARARIMRDPRFRPIIEQAISEQSSIIPDLGGSVVRGLGSLPTAAGRLTDLVPGMQGNLVSRGLISAGEYLSQRGTSMMSPGGQMQQRLFQAVMDEAENQGLVDQAKVALREAISNPRMLANITAESIPSLVASFGGGLAVRGAAAAGSRLAGRQLGAEGARRAAFAGAIGTESLLEGGGSADDVYKQIKGLPEEELQKSPEYQGLLRNMSPDEARESLARSAARQAGLQTAAISGTIGAALPGAETMPFARATSAGVTRRVLTGAGTEAVQEAGQEGGAAFSENLARQRAEIERELTAGVGSRAALGAVVGGITGGAFGGLRSSAPDVDRTEDAELLNALRAGQPEFQRAAAGEFVSSVLPVSQEEFAKAPPEIQQRLLGIAQDRESGATLVTSTLEGVTRQQFLKASPEQQRALVDRAKEVRQTRAADNEQQPPIIAQGGADATAYRFESGRSAEATMPDAQPGETQADYFRRTSQERANKASFVSSVLPITSEQFTSQSKAGQDRLFKAALERVERDRGEGEVILAPGETTTDYFRRIAEERARQIQFVSSVLPITPKQFMDQSPEGQQRLIQTAQETIDRGEGGDRKPFTSQAGRRAETYQFEEGREAAATSPDAMQGETQADYFRRIAEERAREAREAGRPKAPPVTDTFGRLREEVTVGPEQSYTQATTRAAQRFRQEGASQAPQAFNPIVEGYIRQKGVESPRTPISIPALQQYIADNLSGAIIPIKQLREQLDRYVLSPEPDAGFILTKNKSGSYVPVDRGPTAEYSARGQPGQAPQAEQTTPKAFDYMSVINDRLNKIRAKGKQGETIAAAIEKELRSGKYQPEQLYAAFKGGEVMANILPSGANHEIRFVERILKGDVEAQGRRLPPEDAASAGIIEISLSDSVLGMAQETAAHEAFHVLQDYYGQYDPAFKKLMGQSFKDNMTLDQVDSTIKRKLQTIRMPGSKDSYWDFLTSTLPGKIDSAREAEAYVFGSLHDAAKRGIPMTGLKPAFTRFVNMLTKFTRRMGNVLRGDGFNSPDDVFGRVVEGDAGRFAGEAAPEFRGGEEFSARTLPKVSSTYQSAIDKVTGTYGQEPDSLFRRALDGLTGARAKYTMLYGGDKPKRVKATDSLIMSSVNQFHAGHLADQLLKSKGRPDAAVIGRSWESANNNDARIAYMMNGGGYRLDKTRGVLVRDPKVKSIKDMFANKVPTDEAGQKRFQTYAVANLERDLRKQGKKGFLNLTDAEVASVIQESERSFPQWKEVIKDLNNWNNSLLQLLVDAGNIDQATKDKLMQVFYTPLYRKMEDDAYHNADMVVGPALAGTLKNPTDALKRREGGEEPIGDLFENIVRNADAIVKSALKNVAMENTAKGLEIAGLAEKVPAKLDGAKNIMTLRRDGKDVYYRIDDPLMMIAISTAPMQIQNGFYKAMASISGFLRDMITLAPPFMLANLWRGKIVAYVQEGVPLWRSTILGLRDALKQTSSMTSIGDVTGFGGYTWGQGSQDLVGELKRQVRLADGTASMLDRAKGIVQGLRHIGEATEFAERVKVVDHLISKGVNPDDAAFQGYLLAPFSRRGMGTGFFGYTASFLAPIVPFLNAKIQGTYRLLENEKNLPKHKFAMQLMARGAVVTMFSMALAALASDDERWESEPVERKMLYDIVYVGGGEILLPRAFEVGTWFGAIPVMLFDAARKEHGGDLGKAFAFAITNTLGFSPIPAAVDPMFTVMTNYDFFRGRELESAGMKSRPASERVQEDTSRVAEGVAYAINNSIGQLPRGMKMELSPMQAQSLLQGYLGTAGTMILSAVDGFLGWTGVTPGKPAGPLGDPNTPLGIAVTLSGMRRFVKGDEEKVSRFVGDFYDLKREVTQWTTAMNDARLAGDMARANEIASERSDLFSLKRQVDKASRDVGEISRRMRAIQNNPNMDPQEKADALVPLRQRRNEITGTVMQLAIDRGVR